MEIYKPQSRLILSTAILVGLMTVSMLPAQDGPTYKANVPKELLTPDKMQTRYLGELDFQDGFFRSQRIHSTIADPFTKRTKH